jgi:predicted ATPase
MAVKHFSTFQLDTANECIFRNGKRLGLTRKAFAVARYLIEHPGQLVTKDELMEAIWPDIYVQEGNLKVYIGELRIALGDQAARPVFIETRQGKGYCFIAQVSDKALALPATTRQPKPKRLFGRDVDSKKLSNCFEAAASGQRRVIFVTGEAGIGKTTLIDDFIQRTSGPAIRITRGQCVEGYPQQEAYYPVLEALGRLTHEQEVVQTLARYAPRCLLQFPSLMTETAKFQSYHEAPAVTSQRMLREICDFIDALTVESPLILCLEDLHWSDQSTVACIAALARRTGPARFMLVASYRPVGAILARHPVRRLKIDLQSHGQCEELSLEKLDRSALAAYLEDRYPGILIPEQIVEFLHQLTEGNPLFIEMSLDYLATRRLLRAGAESLELSIPPDDSGSEVPESLSRFVEKYIEQLTREEVEILTAATAVGPGFCASTIASVLGREVAQIETYCNSLCRRQLIIEPAELTTISGEPGASYRFRHSLYREILYRRCSLAAKRGLRHRMGQVTDDAPAVRPDKFSSDLPHRLRTAIGNQLPIGSS